MARGKNSISDISALLKQLSIIDDKFADTVNYVNQFLTDIGRRTDKSRLEWEGKVESDGAKCACL